MTDLFWTTEKRKINDLIPTEGNPRQMTAKQVEDLKKSLTKFNLAEIPAINQNNKILAGHQRLKILQLMGRGEEAIDVRVPSRILTEQEEREYLIRSNKNTGEWDFDALANNFEIEELKEWGFEDEDFDGNFGGDGKEETEEVPAAPETPKSQRGFIYQLGRHRLMNGDSTNAGDVALLMDGKKADMVFTDPPYGVSYSKKNEFLNSIDKGNSIQKDIENDDWDEEGIKIFWKKAFTIIRDNLADVNSYYIFGPQIQGMMMMMMMEAGLPYRHVIIWVKNNHVLGRCDYNYKHEPIFFGWTKTHKFYGFGEFQTSVWTVDKPHKSDLHPTMKPIELMKNGILNSSLNDQICLDPFLGSGSTLIACEQTNRICYGMEIDPVYADVAIKRYCNLTGANEDEIYNSAVQVVPKNS